MVLLKMLIAQIGAVILCSIVFIGFVWIIHGIFTQSDPPDKKTSLKDKAQIQFMGWGILIVITLVLMGAGFVD